MKTISQTLYLFWTLMITFSSCDQDQTINLANFGSYDYKTLPKKDDFLRKEPANELGIRAKVIALVHRKSNQRTEEMLINREYLPEDVHASFLERCKTDETESPFSWKDCQSNPYGLFVKATGGVPAPKNRTISYLELSFDPFKRRGKNGKEEICVLDEVYKSKVYIVLRTFSLLPSNDTLPKGPVDMVQLVHQHELDTFGEHFLSIFGDKIETNLIYNFGEDEYYDRDPPYECFLSIGSSENVPVIEEKCSFFCATVGDSPPSVLMEEILAMAKMEAEDEERKDDKSHDEL